MSYVPPHNRNKSTTEEPTMERKNPFQRRPQRREYRKPLWEVEKEQEAATAAEKIKEQERGLENTEENFPVLGTGVSNHRTWDGRKFNELALDWKETEDREKDIREEAPTEEYNFILPKFRNLHRFAEPEEEKEVREEKPSDEWELVQRKQRKVRRDLTEEELEVKYGIPEDHEPTETVWGATEEHQTCWDERRV
jgi:hypothetical protein